MKNKSKILIATAIILLTIGIGQYFKDGTYFIQVYISSQEGDNGERFQLSPRFINCSVGYISKDFPPWRSLAVIDEFPLEQAGGDNGYFEGESNGRFPLHITLDTIIIDIDNEWFWFDILNETIINDAGLVEGEGYFYVNGSQWKCGWQLNNYYYSNRENDILYWWTIHGLQIAICVVIICKVLWDLGG